MAVGAAVAVVATVAGAAAASRGVRAPPVAKIDPALYRMASESFKYLQVTQASDKLEQRETRQANSSRHDPMSGVSEYATGIYGAADRAARRGGQSLAALGAAGTINTQEGINRSRFNGVRARAQLAARGATYDSFTTGLSELTTATNERYEEQAAAQQEEALVEQLLGDDEVRSLAGTNIFSRRNKRRLGRV